MKARWAKMALAVLFCVVVALQCAMIAGFQSVQTGDARVYSFYARNAAEANAFYPSADDLISPYAFNPGYVNFLALCYRIVPGDTLPMIANLLFSAALALSTGYIALRLFGKRQAAIALLLFLLFPTYVCDVVSLRTDLMFTTLAFGAFALTLTRMKGKYVLAGIVLGCANFVRPLAIVFLAGVCLKELLHKVPLRRWIALPAGAVTVTLLFGLFSYLSCGHFVYQATTGGVNLIMGANDDADGSYNNTVFEQGKIGYRDDIASLTFIERDEFWRSQAVAWIGKNPLRYASLVPRKLFYLYAADTYAMASLYPSNYEIEYETDGAEHIRSVMQKLFTLEFGQLDYREWILIANQTMYMFVLLAAIVSATLMLRRKHCLRQLLPLLCVVALGTGISLITVGSARYHYPFLPVFFMLAGCLFAKGSDLATRGKSGYTIPMPEEEGFA